MTPAPSTPRCANFCLGLILLCAGLIFVAPIACTQVPPSSPATDKTTAVAPASTPAQVPAPDPSALPPSQLVPSAAGTGPGTPTVQVGGSPVRPQNGDYYSQIYKIPTEQEIIDVLQRVRVYLDASTASRI